MKLIEKYIFFHMEMLSRQNMLEAGKKDFWPVLKYLLEQDF